MSRSTTRIPLLALLAACSFAPDVAGTASTSPPPRASTSPASAEPQTETETKPESPRQPTIGHCAGDEVAWFSCGVRNGKVGSVCGTADGSRLTYRFGPPGQPEIDLGGRPEWVGSETPRGHIIAVGTEVVSKWHTIYVDFRPRPIDDDVAYRASTSTLSSRAPVHGFGVFTEQGKKLDGLPCEPMSAATSKLDQLAAALGHPVGQAP